MRLKHLILCALLAVSLPGFSNPVVVKMNVVSKTMSLVEKDSGTSVPLPEPTNREYILDLNPGQYVLSAYADDGETLNGTIMLNVTNSSSTQEFAVLTCTAYVTNTAQDGQAWSIENNDYKLDVSVNTREGDTVEQTAGKSTVPNRYTFLAFSGNSYKAAFIPDEKHQLEGYMTLYRVGTLTANVNVNGAIPSGDVFSVTVPADADLQLGMKFTHFTDFTSLEPKSIEKTEAGKTYNYILANGQVYNYRTWKPGGLTHGGYFTMNTSSPEKCPKINFNDDDYAKADPKAVNHSPLSNNGYETGDILLNINPQHHLKLNVGENFLVHGMRMWELTDNSTNNYFFEPDFHYTVFDTDFKLSDNVIEIDNADTNVSAWSKITAKAAGTAIVMVTYDGINLNYYSGADKKEYLGGEYWGAIWPENTGVFVVTVGENNSSVVPNMTVNEKYNMGALRLAGNDVDAEHDVFYFLDSEAGYSFTFKPENVVSVDMASPRISDTEAKYTGFSSDGIVKNDDGSYTILLKEGRNIVRMTDAAGKSAYQVLRARPCHREISNQTRPGSSLFQPGDKVKIQYSGLFHPANKIAGIYNMSAYVTYNGIPNGSSLILGSGQYTFGSVASAQAVTVEIPSDYDVKEHPQLVMDEGVIQVNGFGDPIGNHRNISPTAGRSPNFTAVSHKTYFGSIPDIRIDLVPVKYFNISLTGAPADAEVTLSFNGAEMLPDDTGVYSGTFGDYTVVADADGYKRFRKTFSIGDDSDDNVTFSIDMQLLGNAWDGKTMSEPKTADDGTFLISNGAELAWFADKANADGGVLNAELTDDIELGNFDWTPIGSSSKKYSGSFKGAGHSVSEIYVNAAANYKGLFGYVNDADIERLTLSGSVSGAQYVGGLAGYVAGKSKIDRVANYCTVSGSKTYVGGVVGYLYSANDTLTNCYNAGHVSGTTNCGGLVGNNNAKTVMTNIFNVGSVEGTTVGACVGGTTAKDNLSGAYAIYEYQIKTNQTLVTESQMASGEVAYLLGDAFFQTIGEDLYPNFDGLRVYHDDDTDEYYNLARGFKIDLGDGDDDVTVEDDNVTLHVKGDYGLSVIADPVGGRLTSLTWSSDNEDVVSVDNDGVLTALAKGVAKITASAIIDGETVTDSCAVTVIGAVAKELSLEINDVSLDLTDNPAVVVTAKYGPEFADEPQVIWYSSDENVVTVGHDGSLSATLTAAGVGDATVRVEHAANPEVFAECMVHVTDASAVVDDVLADSDVKEIDIFDISGKIVGLHVAPDCRKALTPGLYIIKYGKTVKEVLIK